jgi:hypothetical protein
MKTEGKMSTDDFEAKVAAALALVMGAASWGMLIAASMQTAAG